MSEIEETMFGLYLDSIIPLRLKGKNPITIDIVNELREEIMDRAEDAQRDHILLAGGTDASLKGRLVEMGDERIVDYLEKNKPVN